MSPVPVYFSHSYRREDRDVNSRFWRAFCDAGFSFTVDPESTSLNTTTLELMMARSVGYAAVVTFRPEEERYQCSPFILYEYGLAVQAHRPRMVLLDKRVPPRYFQAHDTIKVEFDVAALDRCTDELERQLDQFRDLTSSRFSDRPYRKGRVGVALATESGNGTPGAEARRAVIERFIDAGGDAVTDLTAVADDPWQLAESADGCDFVVVDLDDHEALRIADFLQGRGTPLLKVARHSAASTLPERLLGSAPLRRAAAAADLVTYWGDDAQEFESRMREKISRATKDRTELTDFTTGHRYFRSLGREARPVFVSNAGPANDLAKDLAQALDLENIPFFHYRFHNPIGLGQRWTDQLDRMVAASKVFVPLIDDTYWTREYCRQEYAAAVRLADAGRIAIVPGLLEGHATGPEVPYQGADLRDRPRQEQVKLVVSQLDELLAAHVNRGSATEAIGPVAAGQTSVDVAIITILEEEYEAVLRLLKQVRQVVGSATLDNQHAWVVGEVDGPQMQGPYTVALAMSGVGSDAAVVATKNTLQAFDPRCILIVGVAGGFGGLNLGDVVVADRICAYEYGKIDDGFKPRNEMDRPTDAALSSAARTLAARHPDWYRELDLPEDLRHLSPQIVVGHVASGDKVVDDPTDAFFASVMRSRRELLAVEMEGAGAAAAIQDAREMQHAVSFGMIRGISDHPPKGGSRPSRKVGQSRQTETRDAWKARASATAAAAAVQLIRLSWPRPPRAGSQL